MITLKDLNEITDYDNFDEIKISYHEEGEYLNPRGYMEVHKEELKRKEDYWNVTFMTAQKIWKENKEIIVMYLGLEKK